MSRLTDLIARVKERDPDMGQELEREFKVLASRRAFGLNFERHRPESVELPGRPVRKGDKVRILPERGSMKKGDQRLWKALRIEKGMAHLSLIDADPPETCDAPVEDLVVVAEFRDYIYPGLASVGKVERGNGKPFHTVINGENFHALEALTYTHRGKIDAIYIDPPYNSGARDWKYNNDYVDKKDIYRHSKWLAMVERRLKVAKELLRPADSVLIVTIDEKEYLRLGLLLEQMFPDGRIQMISALINPAVVARPGGFGRSDEYIFLVLIGKAAPKRLRLGREWVSSKGRTHTGNIRWDLLRRSGTNAERSHSPGCFFPIYVDPKRKSVAHVGNPLPQDQSKAPEIEGLIPVLPIRKNKSEGNWQWSPETFKARMAQGRVRIGGNKDKGFVVYILKDGEFQKVKDGEFGETSYDLDGSIIVEGNDPSGVLAIPGSQWNILSHDSTQYGSRLLSDLLPDRKFPFPKSLYAVEDVLRFFVHDKPDAIILDFFAGSGTTAHAVMRLNRQDGSKRQCISVTNNEVAAEERASLQKMRLRPGDAEWEEWGIFEYIAKPRIEAATTGKTSYDVPIKGNYKFIDEFPMAEGFAENTEFLVLTYETPVAVHHNLAFQRIAPLLWMRAGAQGRRVDELPDRGWEVADTYGLLVNLDLAAEFRKTLKRKGGIRIAYIVTDDERRFQSIARRLPRGVESIRLYESYLLNFRFSMER